MIERTAVAIVGGGPVGLVLASRLGQAGVDVVVLDRTDDGAPENKGRAGLWEHRTVRTLERFGLAERLLRDGRRHATFELRCFGEQRRLVYRDFLGDAISHYAYPQDRLVEDCRSIFATAGGDLRRGATVTAVRGLAAGAPLIQYRTGDGRPRTLACEIVVGADGTASVTRRSAPAGALTAHIGRYPTSTLSAVAQTPSPLGGTIYATGEDGMAAHAVRTDRISRLFLQCTTNDDERDWPEHRIWEAFDARTAIRECTDPDREVQHGPISEVSIFPMRSHIIVPLQHGPLFLAGDAAHTIPPMGAKGANLGIADAADLAEAIIARYKARDPEPLAGYSTRRLVDIWHTQAFSRRFVELLCPPPDDDYVAHRIRQAQLEELMSGGPLAQWFVHRYAGANGDGLGVERRADEALNPAPVA